MNLADRIHEERQWLGFPIERLAEGVGVSTRQYAAFEDGTATPTPEQITRLAALFGMTVERLHGAPLDEGLGPAVFPLGCGFEPTPEERQTAMRFAEYFRHAHAQETGETT